MTVTYDRIVVDVSVKEEFNKLVVEIVPRYEFTGGQPETFEVDGVKYTEPFTLEVDSFPIQYSYKFEVSVPGFTPETVNVEGIHELDTAILGSVIALFIAAALVYIRRVRSREA